MKIFSEAEKPKLYTQNSKIFSQFKNFSISIEFFPCFYNITLERKDKTIFQFHLSVFKFQNTSLPTTLNFTTAQLNR